MNQTPKFLCRPCLPDVIVSRYDVNIFHNFPAVLPEFNRDLQDYADYFTVYGSLTVTVKVREHQYKTQRISKCKLYSKPDLKVSSIKKKFGTYFLYLVDVFIK